jgi:site-specific recombinase XerC
MEAASMRKRKAKLNYRRIVLRLPDLDHSKMAVLNTLTSPGSRRVYQFAINQFIAWYCSEPRLAFNRIVVVRYRMYLEGRRLAANTINQQLAAVRRLAHEAADAGLLSPDLAAGISRVKGVKQLGCRSGNWLSIEQSSEVLSQARGERMREKRDYAMLALLFGCGLRRSELVGLKMSDVQTRQGHWAIVDLIGKGGHIRTVPIPGWAKQALDAWTMAAEITDGRVFRAVSRAGKVWGPWNYAERCLVRGQGLLRESGAGTDRPTRPAANLRQAVSFERRRVGADSIPARPRIGTNNGALPGLQTEPRAASQRPLPADNRDRTLG